MRDRRAGSGPDPDNVAASEPARRSSLGPAAPPVAAPAIAPPTIAVHLIGMAAIAVSTWAAVTGRAPAWFTIPVDVAVIFLMFAVVVHEAVHGTLSAQGWVNGVCGRTAWILVWPLSCFSAFKFIHHAHHRYTNDPADDPDAFAAHAPRWQLPLRWMLTDVFYMAYYLRRVRSRPARELAETALMVTLSVTVLAAAAVTGNLWTLMIVFIIPQRIAITGFAWCFDWLPHHGLQDTPARDRYRTTRVRVGMEWLFTPLLLSQNYHAVHHLQPWVPWYRYLRTWRENEQTFLQRGVPVATIFGRPLTPEQVAERPRLAPRAATGRVARPSAPASPPGDAPARVVADEGFDVVVVGSGPAGCAAAILLGRRGLKVALLEAHRDAHHYKRLCTHSIRSSVWPTLHRLGLDEALQQRGAVRSHEQAWTRHGWVRQTPAARGRGPGYNISRRTLDPLLRSTAAETPGVTLMQGARVTELSFDRRGRVDGVLADVDGSLRRIGAALVVGADGRTSKVAELASLPGRRWRNDRFVYFAEYRNVALPAWCTTALWLMEPDAAYVFANEDDTTLLVAMPAKDRLPAFSHNREAAVVAMCAKLPDGPDLGAAQRVSDVVGTTDYPSITRRRIVAPGVALIGDAAMVSDPLWGNGCGWALQSAEWLCDAVADRLVSGTARGVDAAARRYQRRHRRSLLPRQVMNIDFSRRRRFRFVQRLFFAAAAHDPRVGDAVMAVGSGHRSPLTLASPPLLIRAAQAALAQRSAAAPDRGCPAPQSVDIGS